MDQIRVRETEFVVSALPEDDGEQGWSYGEAFDIKVSYRGDDRWAVIHAGRCLSITGTWGHERMPSNRADKWIATHRFDLPTALRLAREQAERVTVNGHTALDVRERIAEAVES